MKIVVTTRQIRAFYNSALLFLWVLWVVTTRQIRAFYNLGAGSITTSAVVTTRQIRAFYNRVISKHNKEPLFPPDKFWLFTTICNYK